MGLLQTHLGHFATVARGLEQGANQGRQAHALLVRQNDDCWAIFAMMPSCVGVWFALSQTPVDASLLGFLSLAHGGQRYRIQYSFTSHADGKEPYEDR